MKEYKFKDKNDFIFGTLPQFRNFEVYTGMEVYDILEDNIDILPKYKDRNISIFKKEYSVPIPVPKGFKKYRKFHLSLSNRLDEEVWFNPSSPKQHSLTQKPGYRREKGFHTYLNSEHYIRSMKTSNLYLYLKIPYEFLRDHLGYNVALANVQQYYQAIDTLEEITIPNIVKMQDEYDEVFPDTIKYEGHSTVKAPYSYIWRRDMFPYMVYTLYKYGYYNPVMSAKQNVVFFGGTHRLACGPAVKRDVPYLVLLQENRKNPEYELAVTPPCMVDGKEMLLKIHLYEKKIEGWYIKEEQFKTDPKLFRSDELTPPTTSGIVSSIYKVYKDKKPDILISS